jgi:hypothetical protein
VESLLWLAIDPRLSLHWKAGSPELMVIISTDPKGQWAVWQWAIGFRGLDFGILQYFLPSVINFV